MQTLSPNSAALLADAILVLHVGIVAFVVLGALAVLVGGLRGWRWVRGYRWRLVHALLMVFIAAQAWLGALCPLTIWEQALREHAGQAAYRESFIAHWLSRLIFFEAPWWAFVAAYSAFAALVVVEWVVVRPRRPSN
jgi:polyferredoxin